MSTPSFYPPQPAPGSNALGSFTIGVSPVGTIPPFDWRVTVISQYANSPVLLNLIQDFNDCIDQTKNIEAFYDQVWNVLTAEGYGLDVWGRIVGVGRVLQVDTGKYFGFEEAGNASADPFNQSPFFNGVPFTSNYRLSDQDYRRLILAKALANISDGSVPAINQLLINLFSTEGRGNCYVTDGGDMTMTYTFEFSLTPVERAIIEQSGVIPKPVGVSATLVETP